MRSIRRFEMVELIIPALATATRFNFPDIPQLRSDVTKDIVIRGLSTFTVEAIPLSFNNNPVTTFANMAKSSLTLYINGEESVFRFPLIRLQNINSNNAAAPLVWFDELNQFDNLQIDWTKSYVTTPTAYANAAAFAFIFGVSYKRYAAGTMKQIQDAQGLNPGCDAPQMM